MAPDEAWISTEAAVAIPHPEPLTFCHILVAPRRHVRAFYDLDVEEQRLVWDLVSDVRTRVASALKVHGFEVGFQDGSCDDEGHTHIHVVPRSPGERISLPGGVEWVHSE